MKFGAHDWPVISALLDEALELPAERRGRWLDALPEGPRTHRHTLEQLLADLASVETLDFMQTLPKVGVGDEGLAAAPEEGSRTVGPYRLLREIGRGGMGSVWLAERVDGLLKRQVALKLPHPGLATRAFGERLARERDILASLAHPHIARLYDAGVSSQGQPYIALAYVQGQNLIDHCDAQRLDVRERIALFQQVLDAVQYAHAHLVIHRDLKPSNVLVDEQGQVHLLDFGIAKLLVDGQAQATELTLDAGQALTPDYASPEQIAGGAITTASDVYSLGVLLYELLAGRRPYRLKNQAQAALEQAVREVEVPRPSTATLGVPDAAMARATTPGQLARALRGDLDTIALMALKKLPEQRYATADAFKQDLQRHLDGAPVLARPDTAMYRTGKFLRHHRIGVLATALVIFALGAGLAGTAWQAQQARQQAQRAQAVQDFLVGLFKQADPDQLQGRDMTVRELLDRGQQDLQTKLANQPRLQEQLDGVLVEIYDSLADYAKALPLARTRLDLALRLYGAQSLEYGDALESLAAIQGGFGDRLLSIQSHQQARDILRNFQHQREDKLLMLDGHLAFALQATGQSVEAADLLRGLLPKLETRFGSGSWEIIANKGLLAAVYAAQGDHTRALAILDEIEPLLDRADSAHAVDAATLRNNIASVQKNANQLGRAEQSLRRALADFARLQGADSADSITAEFNLATVLQEEGKFGAAAKACDALTQHSLRVYGAEHSETKRIESFCVEPFIMVGRTDDAEAAARRSVHDAEHTPGLILAVVHSFTRRLGLALVCNVRAQEAAQVLKNLQAQEQAAGTKPGDKFQGRTRLYLAGANAALGELDAAADMARQAEQFFAAGDHNDVEIAHAQLTQALALARSHQAQPAEALIAQAEEHLQKATVSDHPVYLLVDLVRAEALRAGGRQDEAERVSSAARERLRASAGAVLPKVIPLIF